MHPCPSEISASAPSLPVIEPCGLESLDFEPILFAYVVILIGKWLQEVHDVRLVQLIPFLRHVLVLIVRLLLGDGLRVDRRENLFFRKLLRLEILSYGCLLISNGTLGLVEGTCGKWDKFVE